jgi:hypothetical protein
VEQAHRQRRQRTQCIDGFVSSIPHRSTLLNRLRPDNRAAPPASTAATSRRR